MRDSSIDPVPSKDVADDSRPPSSPDEDPTLLAKQATVPGSRDHPMTETVAIDGNRSQDLFSSVPDQIIGRYKLVKELGHGGFGIVWQAEQTEPIRRDVALKIIKPGMDSAEIIARFSAERQALALMDHPNIASVLDAGTTEGGRPYFVMELVKGEPITDYCDARRLGVRRRLTLFIAVCQGVQHAHQKGILHRDLKPSNILVTEVDGKPVPKVIDFGIAKALGTSPDAVLQVSLLQTQAGAVIGTPQYMSPEQAGSAADVDTRSDVYTLGTILYELLTGQTPLNFEELPNRSLDVVLSRVRDGVSKRPSSRLMPATEAIRKFSASRNSDPKRLSANLRGDLDWIVLKALEKERDRRYETANALAKDLQRYLDCEPVSAGPPSSAYRLKKLVQRNQLAFGAALCVVLALVAGVVTSTSQAIRAREAERLARERLGHAEKARDAAENLIADAVFGLRDKLMPIGKIAVLDGMVKAAEGYYTNLPPELASSTTKHHQVRLMFNRALVAAARSDDDATEEAALEALDMARKLAAGDPNDLRFVDDQTSILLMLALLRTEQDAPEEASIYGDEACQLADRWLQLDPKAVQPLAVKLNAYARQMIVFGEQNAISPDAIATFSKMGEVSKQLKMLGHESIETATADALGKLGQAMVMSKLMGKQQAAPLYREADAAFVEAMEKFGDHPYTRQMLLSARNHVVRELMLIADKTNDTALRADLTRQRFEIVREREKLTELEPLRLEWWKQLSAGYADLVTTVEQREGPVAALELAEKAYVLGEKAASPHCDRPRIRWARVYSRLVLVRALRKVKPDGWGERCLTLLNETATIDLAPIKRGRLDIVWNDFRDAGQLWWDIAKELDRPETGEETLRQFRNLAAAKAGAISLVTTKSHALRDGIEATTRIAEYLQKKGRPAEATEFTHLRDKWKLELAARFPSDAKRTPQ